MDTTISVIDPFIDCLLSREPVTNYKCKTQDIWCKRQHYCVGERRRNKKDEKNKENKQQGNDMYSNAVHISLPDYCRTHLIAQGISAITLIITWCIVFFSEQLFWLLQNLHRLFYSLLFSKGYFICRYSPLKTPSPPLFPFKSSTLECQQECVCMLYLLHLWPI